MDAQCSSLPWVYLRSDGTRFEIYPAAWSEMQCFVQSRTDATEAGGVLLGRHLRDRSAIVVDRVTTPLPGDRRSRVRFYRGRRRHQAIIDAAWQESEGTCTYLGEWHTHPEPVPTPSQIDVGDWKRRLRDDHYTEPLFFVIVGVVKTAVWEGWRSGLIVPLQEGQE